MASLCSAPKGARRGSPPDVVVLFCVYAPRGRPWLWKSQAGACGRRQSGLALPRLWVSRHGFIGALLGAAGPVLLVLHCVHGLCPHGGKGGELGVFGVGSAWQGLCGHGWWGRSLVGCPGRSPALPWLRVLVSTVVRVGPPAGVVRPWRGCRHGGGRGNCAVVGTAPMSPCGIPEWSCGLGVALPSCALEGAADELDVAFSAGALCVSKAARRARLVDGRMMGIRVYSVLGLLGCRWGSAVRDIGRRCLPRGPLWLLPASSRKSIHHSAGGSVRMWLWAPVVPLVPPVVPASRGGGRLVSILGVCSRPWSGP